MQAKKIQPQSSPTGWQKFLMILFPYWKQFLFEADPLNTAVWLRHETQSRGMLRQFGKTILTLDFPLVRVEYLEQAKSYYLVFKKTTEKAREDGGTNYVTTHLLYRFDRKNVVKIGEYDSIDNIGYHDGHELFVASLPDTPNRLRLFDAQGNILHTAVQDNAGYSFADNNGFDLPFVLILDNNDHDDEEAGDFLELVSLKTHTVILDRQTDNIRVITLIELDDIGLFWVAETPTQTLLYRVDEQHDLTLHPFGIVGVQFRVNANVDSLLEGSDCHYIELEDINNPSNNSYGLLRIPHEETQAMDLIIPMIHWGFEQDPDNPDLINPYDDDEDGVPSGAKTEVK